MEAVQELPEELTLVDIFSHDVILSILESKLDLQDLANLRLVCWTMNEIILSRSKYLWQTCLVLDKAKMLSTNFLQGEIFLKPKHLKIYPFKISREVVPYSVHDRITARVCELAQHCETLEIWNQQYRYSCLLADETIIELSDESVRNGSLEIQGSEALPPHCPSILQAIMSTLDLKRLILNRGAELFLGQCAFMNMDGDWVEKLQEVVFNHPSFAWGFYIPPVLLKARALQSISHTYSFDSKFKVPHEQRLRFQKLICQNSSTLRELGNLYPWFWEPGSLRVGHMSNLRFLKMYLDRVPGYEQALEFYVAHVKQLTHLDLRFSFDEVLTPLKDCFKLRSLSLTMIRKDFLVSFWDVLENMKNIPLQVLKLHSYSPSCLHRYDLWPNHRRRELVNVEVISLLPKTLKCLEMRGLSLDCLCFKEVYDGAKLNRLSLITRLKLSALPDVTNAVVLSVFKYLRKLISLELTNLPKVNGDVLREEMCSIRNLKELKSLRLNIGEMTADVLVKEIKFLSLQYLDIMVAGLCMSEASVLQLMKRNPGLKRLECYVFNGKDFFTRVQSQFPQVVLITDGYQSGRLNQKLLERAVCQL